MWVYMLHILQTILVGIKLMPEITETFEKRKGLIQESPEKKKWSGGFWITAAAVVKTTRRVSR